MAATHPARRVLDRTDPETVDFADPRLHAEYDLSALWRRMRDEAPVHWQHPRGPAPGFWVISRHADVQSVYQARRGFTSERGNVLATLLAGGDSASGKMMAVTDGPRHAAVRSVLQKALSPRVMAEMEIRIAGIARTVVTTAGAAGSCDFARDIAAQIPLAVMCELLAIPAADRQQLLNLTRSALSAPDHRDSQMAEILARNELLLYFNTLVAERRRQPGGDVVSLMIQGEADGVALSDEEVVFNCYSLMLGGDETSRLAMVGGLLALLDHPAEWDRLRSGKVDLMIAVDEILRWTTPAMHFGRAAVEDVIVGGELIRRDELVTLWNVSANRDPVAFAEPDRLDLARRPNRHLSFGSGHHFCIGAYLGKLELKSMLEALQSMIVEVEVTGPVERIYSNFLSGVARLPVRLTLNS